MKTTIANDEVIALETAYWQALKDGDAAAMLGYTIKLDLEIQGTKHSMECAESSAWVRTDDEWRCVLHSETPLGDPFGRSEKK